MKNLSLFFAQSVGLYIILVQLKFLLCVRKNRTFKLRKK